MRLITSLTTATALLAGSAVAGVIGRDSELSQRPPNAISSSSSSGRNTTSTVSHVTTEKDGSRTTVRQHVFTAWVIDITTVSDLVEDITTTTKIKHETAIVSKAGDAPYTTMMPHQHEQPAQPKHTQDGGFSVCPGPHCINESLLPETTRDSKTTKSQDIETHTITPSYHNSITNTSHPVPPLCNGEPCGPKSTAPPASKKSEDFGISTTTISRTDVTFTEIVTVAPSHSESAGSTALMDPSIGGASFGLDCTTGGYGADVCLPSNLVSSLESAFLPKVTSTHAVEASQTSESHGENRLKRAAAVENPTSVLASWVSATNLWPSGVSPFMTPTATPPASAKCWSNVGFSFELSTRSHTKLFERAADTKNSTVLSENNKVALSQNYPVTISLVNGTLIDGQNRIGGIVANGQFQFDGPAQAGTIYDGGWSVCNPDGTAYRLTLGANMTFWQCNSGAFDNIYAWPLTDSCTEVDLLITQVPTRAEQTSETSILASTTVPLNRRDTTAASVPSGAGNQWAHTININGKDYTVWKPFPIVTVSGTTYSAEPVTAYIPVVVTPSASVQKRDIDDDVEIPLNYEWNTYTITIPAETGIEPSYSDSPESIWTLSQRILIVTEAPYSPATGASVAARDVVGESGSTNSWLTFITTIPAVTITRSDGTFTELVQTMTSLYKTTPCVTTSTQTFTDRAYTATETWTYTVEPPYSLITGASVAARDVESDSSSTDPWLTYIWTVPAATLTEWDTTTTEPAHAYTSLYKTTPYTTAFTRINDADQYTETRTLTIEPPTFTTSSTDVAKLKGRQDPALSTVTEVFSVPVTTVHVSPEPASWFTTESTSSPSLSTSTTTLILDTSSMPTTTVTGSFTSSAPPAASTTSQLSGATSAIMDVEGNLGAFYLTFALTVITTMVAFCL